MLSTIEKTFLLSVARQAIGKYISSGNVINISDQAKGFASLLESRGTFVTLWQKGSHTLRGCIGHLDATKPLYQDVIENAISAATNDNRFVSVKQYELGTIQIEISILSHLQLIGTTNMPQIRTRLFGYGVLISYNNFSATYLPSVWNDLPNIETFLSSLCKKAGLLDTAWRTEPIEVFVYTAEVFQEPA